MADTLEEIFNGAIHPLDVVNGAATIITTDAATRYVIKDVEVMTTANSGAAATLSVNGMKITDLAYSATGSEIIGVNSTITYEDARDMGIVDVAYLSSATALNIEKVGPVFTPAITAQTIAALSGVLLRAVFAPNGDFYYSTWDGNSSTGLYRRTGGATGANSANLIAANYAPSVFDGVSKFYAVTAVNTIYVFDITTGIGASVAIAGIAAGSTYPSLSYANGKLFWRNTYLSTPLKVIDIATSTLITVNTPAVSAGAVQGVGYDIALDEYRFYNGTNYYIASGAALVNGYSIPGTLYNFIDTPAGIYFSLNIGTYHTTDKGIYYLSANSLLLRYQDYATASPITIAAFSPGVTFGTITVIPRVPTVAESNANTLLTMRITGVKSI